MENTDCTLTAIPIVTTKKLKVDLHVCANDEPNLNNEKVTILPSFEQSVLTKQNDSGRTAFEIFPEEVWELILHQLKSSQDVFNVFRAYPELDRTFQNKKVLWLFDLVLPQITKYLLIKKYDQASNYKYLQSKKLLNLRLVSKHWNNAVENSLVNHAENHPAISKESPENSPDNKYGKLIPAIIPQNHLNYTRLQGYHFGASIFHTSNQIETFLEEMRNYSGNPFPGKSVFIKPQDEEATTSHRLIASCVELFEKFGNHVDTLEMHFWDRDSDCHFLLCQNILKCLAFLPKLRSLAFQGELNTYSYVFTNKYYGNESSQKFFPELPNLENFCWKVRFDNQYDSSWITRMVRTYGNNSGLRRLEIVENNWHTINKKFENLKDLHLLLDTDRNASFFNVDTMLRYNFRDKRLLKFTLSRAPPPLQQSANFQRYETNITELLLNLGKGNYQVDELVLENLRLIEKPVLQNIQFVSSVTSLYLEDNVELSYDFLRLLPNLKYLTIFMNNDSDNNRLYNLGRMGNLFARNLILMCYKATNINVTIPEDLLIWDVLPKLEILRASVVGGIDDDQVLEVQYFRKFGSKAFYANVPDEFEGDDETDSEDE